MTAIARLLSEVVLVREKIQMQYKYENVSADITMHADVARHDWSLFLVMLRLGIVVVFFYARAALQSTTLL